MSIRGSAPLTLVVNTNSNGNLINGVNGVSYTVLGYALGTNAAVSVTLRTNATDIIGGIRIPAGDTVVHPPGSTPICQTNTGEPLAINISAAAIVTGHITYTING